jgi:small-conductance mechanosensitive channel
MAAAQAQGRTQQPPDTWYEFLLKQFNLSDIDYGRWMEERRRAFLEATVRNPYFPYSFWLTLWSLFVMGAYNKLRLDRRRERYLTEEMLTDLYNQDLYSRQAARDAIAKYNNHIEHCNRAIEAGTGHGISSSTSENDDLNAKLKKAADNLEAVTSERDRLSEELKQRSAVVTDLSLQLQALSEKIEGIGAGHAVGPAGLPSPTTNAEYMKLVNSLQQQLFAEREKNKRLKGA